MSVKAVIQFRQDETLFGSEATFWVELDSGERHAIEGGRLGRIRLERIGVIRLRAQIDGYFSSWRSIEIREGEMVDLQINPPMGETRRAFGLLGSRDDYLTITETARVMVP